MPKNLVIVESPAKAKTIKNYLGKDFEVVASVGHIIDLPGKSLSVDIENDFKPTYEVIPGKEKVVNALKKAAQSADTIYLASDPDREGEAIAWHVQEEIKSGSKNKPIHRVMFNEITKQGILNAIAHPGNVDMNKVEAQQSRRILDRIVGYQVSPLLWKPLKYGLSAGRVQSVALRLICEREDEIEKFVTEESWTLDANFDVFDKDKRKGSLKATLDKKAKKKVQLKTEAEADAIIKELEKETFVISGVEKKNVKGAAPQPFITARLQQDAIRKLGFKIDKVMRVAQQLYEGIDLGSGPEGLITYMRTDSTRISSEASEAAADYINGKYGKQYLGTRKASKKGGNIQDAHEAIRPTVAARTPESIKSKLSQDQYRLYKLIWERFIASQMADAQYEQTTVLIDAGDCQFRTSGRVMTFPGFTVLYMEAKDEDAKEDDNPALINVTTDNALALLGYDKQQHFTTPPPRFTEASIVKILEQKGIGRPSTYASIISTIVEREYVEIKEKRMFPTELGRVVNTLLVHNFPRIFDETFTAQMEQGLDKVEIGEVKWLDLMNTFYKDFSSELKNAEKKFTVDLNLDIPCPECGKGLTLKYGKNGSFIACTGYPECAFTTDYKRDDEGKIEFVEKQEPADTGIICDKCGSSMVLKKSRYGEMLACSAYPGCKNIKNHIKLNDGTIKVIEAGQKIGSDKCPVCSEGDIILKSGKNGLFAACSNYPGCKYTANVEADDNGNLAVKEIKVETMGNCDKCGKPMVVKKSWRGPFLACSGYPECKNAKSMKAALKEAADGNVESGDIPVAKTAKSSPAKKASSKKALVEKEAGKSTVKKSGAKESKNAESATSKKTKTVKKEISEAVKTEKKKSVTSKASVGTKKAVKTVDEKAVKKTAAKKTAKTK